jgi:hypothetical protein
MKYQNLILVILQVLDHQYIERYKDSEMVGVRVRVGVGAVYIGVILILIQEIGKV